MKIIGLSGTNGSGKDTVGHILQNDYGFLFISITDILRDELIKQGKSTARENMRELSAKWRRESSLFVLIDKAIEVYDSKAGQYKGLVVSSLRNPGEAEHIHELNGKVIWVDADPQIRYQRVISRNRSSDDEKTYEQFIREEQDEMQSSGDSATLSMNEVKKLCDFTIENNYSDTQSLKPIVDKTLQGYIY